MPLANISAVLLLGLSSAGSRAFASDPAPSQSSSTVGMPATIEQLVLPGSELEARPIEDRRAPLVLRINAAYAHGSAFRYDLVYYGLEPGEYDLRSYPKRKDGSAVGDLPPIPVKVGPVLPPGQVEPNPLALEQSPWLGGYRLLLATIGSLWCAGLAAILLVGRRKKAEAEIDAARPLTLADRLKPLVISALAGTLSEGEHAELERLLIGYWRKRLGLELASPSEVITTLLSHPQAGSAAPARAMAAQARRKRRGSRRRGAASPLSEPGQRRERRRGPPAVGTDCRFHAQGDQIVSFAHPYVLALLVVPLWLLGWVWKRSGGRIALPFDHGKQSPRGASGP